MLPVEPVPGVVEPLPYVPVVPVEPVPGCVCVPYVPGDCVPGAGVALGLVLEGCVAALPLVPAAVSDRAPLSEAQATSSNPPAPRAAQSQSLLIFIGVLLQ